MAQWSNNDAASNTPIWVLDQLSLDKDDVANTKADLFNNSANIVPPANNIAGVFGVDPAEAAAAPGVAHAGWVLRTEGTGGRAGRVQYETLVAMSEFVGDSENVAFPQARIIIVTEPSYSGVGAGNAVNLMVVAKSLPEGVALSYHWQVDGGPGSLTFANVANSGVYASANGNTSATLSISNNITLNANTYRVMITAAGANTVYSANAKILF